MSDKSTNRRKDPPICSNMELTVKKLFKDQARLQVDGLYCPDIAYAEQCYEVVRISSRRREQHYAALLGLSLWALGVPGCSLTCTL